MLAGGYSPAIGSVSPVATLVETGDIFTATPRGGGGGGRREVSKGLYGKALPEVQPLTPQNLSLTFSHP